MRLRFLVPLLLSVLVTLSVAAGWGGEEVARRIHSGGPGYWSVSFLNLLPGVTLVVVNCGETRGYEWASGPIHTTNAIYERHCERLPPQGHEMSEP